MHVIYEKLEICCIILQRFFFTSVSSSFTTNSLNDIAVGMVNDIVVGYIGDD